MRCWFLLCAALAAAPDPEAADTPSLDVLLVSVGLHGHAVPLARLAHQLTTRGHRATLLPCEPPGTDGFFIARYRRPSEAG